MHCSALGGRLTLCVWGMDNGQVMEKMTGGELFDRIVKKEKYSEDEARAVVRKLAGALKYCHDMGIVHRDLKVSEASCQMAPQLQSAFTSPLPCPLLSPSPLPPLLLLLLLLHPSLRTCCMLHKRTTLRSRLLTLGWPSC